MKQKQLLGIINVVIGIIIIVIGVVCVISFSNSLALIFGIAIIGLICIGYGFVQYRQK